MRDELTERYGDVLVGSYDCVDRIVLDAYFSLGHNLGGFRVWWRRWHEGSDEQLDNTHLMRMAGRFVRRVRAWSNAHQVPVIDCKCGERKHQLAEEYLATHTVGKVGAQMEKMFDRIVDRTRARLDVPTLRTLFGATQRPGRNGSFELSLQLAAMIETPRYDLTLFTVHFGLLTVKAYTTGEHVLRVEAITHNTTQLRCGRILEKFSEIISKLTGMVDRFTTTLDCVDAGFLPEDTLDQLPLPSRIGTTRLDGIDVNTPRIRSTLAAVLVLAAAPGGFVDRGPASA